MTFPRLYTPPPDLPPFPSAGDHLLADDSYPVYRPATLPFGGGQSSPPSLPLAARLRTLLIEEMVAAGYDRVVAASAVDGLLRTVLELLG